MVSSFSHDEIDEEFNIERMKAQSERERERRAQQQHQVGTFNNEILLMKKTILINNK